MPIGCNCCTDSCPKILSRSRNRKRGAVFQGKASRSWLCSPRWDVTSPRNAEFVAAHAPSRGRHKGFGSESWNREESTDTKLFTWFSKNVLHDCDGDPLRRTRYLLTLLSLMSKPSLNNSPWIFGAPQSGFSRLMRRMSWRSSWERTGRPGRPCREAGRIRTCSGKSTAVPSTNFPKLTLI